MLSFGFASAGALVQPSAPRHSVLRASSPSMAVLTPFTGEELIQVPDGVLRENAKGRPWVDQRPRPRRNATLVRVRLSAEVYV